MNAVTLDEAVKDLIASEGSRVVREALDTVPADLRRLTRQVEALQNALEILTSQMKAVTKGMAASAVVADLSGGTLAFRKEMLKEIRSRLDLTQDQTARLLGVSPATVTSWETGKSRPTTENLVQIMALRDSTRAAVDQELGRTAPPMSADDIRALRDRLGLTQGQMAEQVGVSVNTIAGWEAGRTSPRAGNLEALAELGEQGPDESKFTAGAGTAPSAEEIRTFRQKNGLSQAEFAQKTGVSANTVSNWERGETMPRGKSLAKLVSIMGQR
jgi:DNA-binding transcriptional regulator YiaG